GAGGARGAGGSPTGTARLHGPGRGDGGGGMAPDGQWESGPAGAASAGLPGATGALAATADGRRSGALRGDGRRVGRERRRRRRRLFRVGRPFAVGDAAGESGARAAGGRTADSG